MFDGKVFGIILGALRTEAAPFELKLHTNLSKAPLIGGHKNHVARFGEQLDGAWRLGSRLAW